MITYKCEFCGGELVISPSGDLRCDYCGSKSHFSDAQLREYREFRSNMLKYLAAAAERKSGEKDDSGLWSYAEREYFQTEDGQDVTVEYLFRPGDDGIEMFFARESVIYVFPKGRTVQGERMLQNIARVRFPSADMKGLSRLIPTLKARLSLQNGDLLLAFQREPGFYPLESFGALPYEHAAWILSRLENLCCIMAYSGLVHGGFRLESVYINPYTHEAALYGGWWKTEPERKGMTTDLIDIRKLVLRLLGVNREESPKAFLEFLNSVPETDAYTDFERWDYVIENRLGGRRFARFEKNGKG